MDRCMAKPTKTSCKGGRWTLRGKQCGIRSAARYSARTVFVFGINWRHGWLCSGLTNIIKFADDTKCLKIIENDKDRVELQQTLNNLCEWAEKGAMSFNAESLKYAHRQEQSREQLIHEWGDSWYHRGGQSCGDLCQPFANAWSTMQKGGKQSHVLRQFTKFFHCQDKVFLRLCKQYVRPHLELASPAWSPWQMGVTETIEKIQEKALKMTSGLKEETYEEICK